VIRKLVVMLLTGVICLVGVTSALAVTYNEAPMLRTLVAAGELLPVEERLPEEPSVLESAVMGLMGRGRKNHIGNNIALYVVSNDGGWIDYVNPNEQRILPVF